MADPGDPQPSEQHDPGPRAPIPEQDPVLNPNEPPQEQMQQESGLPGPSNQQRESGKGKKSFPLSDAELLPFALAETNHNELNQMKILDFTGTAPNKLTVGFILALFLVVGMHDPTPTSEASKAATILQNVDAFTRPPFNWDKHQMTATKLYNWSTKTRSNLEKGNHSGYCSRAEFLASKAFPSGVEKMAEGEP